MFGINLMQRALRLLKFCCYVLLPLLLSGFAVFLGKIESSDHNMPQGKVVALLTGSSCRIDPAFRALAPVDDQIILISGVGNGVKKEDFRKYYRKYNINPKSIVLGHLAQTTTGNVEEVWIFSALNQITKLIVVTSDYHLPRTRLMFSLLHPHLEITYYGVTSDSCSISQAVYPLEYLKTCYFLLHQSFIIFADWITVQLIKFS